MRWNRSDRIAAVESSKSFIAVLDSEGNLIDQDDDPQEAFRRALRASPSGTVAVDSTVYTSDDQDDVRNPPDGLRRGIDKALKKCEIPPVEDFNWRNFDPRSELGKRTVQVAREALRERGQEIYEVLLDDVRGLIHEPRRKGEKKKRGGIAAEFDSAWLTGELLRQNQKMPKGAGRRGRDV